MLDRMAAFAHGVRDGSIAAADGGRFTDVVNIGIGGSDLGPAMATLALAPYHDGPRAHYVSNVDGAHVHDVLAGLDPARTLVIVASKTFTTIETMTNARTAQAWLQGRAGRAAPTATSPPSRPRSTRPPPSASTPPASSASGTGSAGATRSGARSACR